MWSRLVLLAYPSAFKYNYSTSKACSNGMLDCTNLRPACKRRRNQITKDKRGTDACFSPPLILCSLSLSRRGDRPDARWFLPLAKRDQQNSHQWNGRVPSQNYCRSNEARVHWWGQLQQTHREESISPKAEIDIICQHKEQAGGSGRLARIVCFSSETTFWISEDPIWSRRWKYLIGR